MGKKPVLGIVGAFCVGLTLTGCRDANTRTEGSPLAKETKPAYQPHPAFGPGAPNATTANNGWNTTPAAKTTPAAGGTLTDAAPPSMTGMKPLDPPPHTDNFGVQPVGNTMTAPPAPVAPDLAPRPGQNSDWGPTPTTSSKFAPQADAPAAPGRMLPPTPALPGKVESLPPLPEPPAPIPPHAGEMSPPPPVPMSRLSVPGELPSAPTPGPSSLSSPAPLPLPPPPPGPAPLPPPLPLN